TLALPGGGRVELLAPFLKASRLWVAELHLPEPLDPYLAQHGHPIRYRYVRDERPLGDYQTVYAREPGSAEMPSAGRPFTPDLVITPERGVRVVDGLLTGWHDPEASHLLMLDAIGGPELVERSYRAALEHGYLWHEFGDTHLILP